MWSAGSRVGGVMFVRFRKRDGDAASAGSREGGLKRLMRLTMATLMVEGA